MRLNFKDVGNLLCPVDVYSGELIEDVVKCTVTSGTDAPTVMTLTVQIEKDHEFRERRKREKSNGSQPVSIRPSKSTHRS